MKHTVDEAGHAEVDKDDWHNVTDAKKRKQIQDRLAQRVRRDLDYIVLRFGENRRTRRRLREARDAAKQHPRHRGTETSYYTQNELSSFHISEAPASLISVDAFNLILDSRHSIATPSTSRFQSSASSSTWQAPKPNLNYELPFAPTVWSALWINGQILGLRCGTVVPARSSPPSSDVPLPLRPTPTQLQTVHFSGIDRFPFPKMRDNFINMGAIVDEEELAGDLCLMPSFSIQPGGVAWDPMAWKIEKPFADKWGFLFL